MGSPFSPLSGPQFRRGFLVCERSSKPPTRRRRRSIPFAEVLERRVVLSDFTAPLGLPIPNSPVVVPVNPPGDNQYNIMGGFAEPADGTTDYAYSFQLTLPKGQLATLTNVSSLGGGYSLKVVGPDGKTDVDTTLDDGAATSFTTTAAGNYVMTLDPGVVGYASPYLFNVSLGSTTITSVTAADNASTAPKTFGSYLLGVPLANTFTVTVDDSANALSKVSFKFDGANLGQAHRVGTTSQWQFTQDMGNLPKTDTKLTVKALDSSGKTLNTYTGTVVLQTDLHETLNITPPGGPDGGESVAGLRFLQKVSLPSTFDGTLPDLPSYYLPKLKIDLGGNAVAGLTTATAGSGATFEFSYDTANLTGDPSVYPVFGSAKAPGSDSTVTLHSVPLPDWLAGATKDFDQKNQTYTLDIAFPAGFQAGLDPNLPTDGGFLNNLIDSFLNQPSSVGVGVNLHVTAKLTKNPGDALVTVKNWFANLTVLGNSVLDKGDNVLPASTIQVADPKGTLNPDTLDILNGLKLTTNPITLSVSGRSLLNLKFGTGSVPLVFPETALSTDVSLSGAVSAFVNAVTCQAGLLITLVKGVPTLDPSGSYLNVNAAGGAALALKAGGSIGIAFTNTKLVAGQAGGLVAAIAQADINVKFSGPLSGPDATLDRTNSKAAVSIGYGFDYSGSIGGDAPELHPDYDHVTVPLFGLPAPPTPDFSSLDNLLNGPGQAQSTGIGDVIPSVGKVMTVLNSVTPVVPQEEQPQALRASVATPATLHAEAVPTTTSQYTIASPVYSSLSDLKFDLNVLSDHANLTAGHHTLDVVLVGLDGSEVPLSQVDLSKSALAANANPLGYSSGWKTIDVPVDSTKLVAGMPYQIEFRLTTDTAADGAAVAVALDRLSTTNLAPKLAVSNPTGSLTAGTGVETISIANTGQAPLHITAPVLSGTNVVLVNPTTVGYVLQPGTSTDIQVKLVNPSAPAQATLTIPSDDLAQPSYRLAITSAGSGGTPAPTPLVSGYGAGRDAFVTTLYAEDLGRKPESSALTFWSRRLAAGVKPQTVALAIWGSPEHRALVNQHLVTPVTFRRSYADALSAGRRAARSQALCRPIRGGSRPGR